MSRSHLRPNGVTRSYLWTVRHRRRDWEWARSRSFKSEPPARRLVERLLSGGWFDTSPIVFVELIRQPLGKPEVVDSWPEERND